MKDLKIGDLVKDSSGNMVQVYSFGHYQPQLRVDFLQIHAHGLSRPLELTKDHLVFVQGVAIPTSMLSVGDYLDVDKTKTGKHFGKITSIKRVIRVGVYAPFTTSSTILVNGVAVSSYVTLQADSSVLVFGTLKTSLSMHWLAHMFQSPHRLLCLWNMKGFCMTETYTDNGISNWVYGQWKISQWLLHQQTSGVVVPPALLLLPLLVAGLLVYTVELGFAFGSCVWTLVLMIAFITSIVLRKKRAFIISIVKVDQRTRLTK